MKSKDVKCLTVQLLDLIMEDEKSGNFENWNKLMQDLANACIIRANNAENSGNKQVEKRWRSRCKVFYSEKE